MNADLNTHTRNNEHFEKQMRWLAERTARAVAKAEISNAVPSVIEQISHPVISPTTSQRPDVAAYVAPATHVDVAGLPTRDAQCAALEHMGLMGLKTSADDIYLIVATACRAGVKDLTGREIQALYEKRYERRIESGTISARVNELITAGRLFRSKDSRMCTATRKMAAPVYVVAKQVRMGY